MRRSLVFAGTALAAASLSTPAAGQGSAVMTHSSCATSMGAAGVASPCEDGSAILFQPAALAGQRSVLTAGVTGITTSGRFTYDYTRETVERDTKTTPVPFGFASASFGGRFAAGVGVFAPYGLGVDWPLDFEGRYVSYDTDLKNIYIQPTVSVRVAPWLSVGGGVDFVRSSLEINQRVDLSEQRVPGQTFTFANLGIPRGTDFADANLAGDGTATTFNVGATLTPSRLFSVGVRYMGEAEVDLDGDAEFSPVPTGLTLAAGNPLGLPAGTQVDALVGGQFAGTGSLVNQGIATSLTLPAQLVVGLSLHPLESLKVVADYQWTGWDSFDVARIDFEKETTTDTDLVLDYQDTNTWRLGADWAATDRLNLRGGFIYNTAAEKDASVSPLLPENERNYYSAGLGYRVAGGLSVDLGYQYVNQADRRGRVRGRTSVAQTAQELNVGVYDVSAHVLNLTLSYHFGGRPQAQPQP